VTIDRGYVFHRIDDARAVGVIDCSILFGLIADQSGLCRKNPARRLPQTAHDPPRVAVKVDIGKGMRAT
jgi:hypothetical protein